MSSLVRKILIILAFLFLIVIVILKVIDANFCKDYLIGLARKNGFELKMAGDIKISLLPSISFVSDSKIELYDGKDRSQQIMEIGAISLKLKKFSFGSSKAESTRSSNIDPLEPETVKEKPSFGLKKIELGEIDLKNVKLFLSDHNVKLLKEKFNKESLSSQLPKNTEENAEKIKFSLDKLNLKNSEIFYEKDGNKTHIHKINLKSKSDKSVKFSAEVKSVNNYQGKISGNLSNIADLLADKETKLAIDLDLANLLQAKIDGNVIKRNSGAKISGSLEAKSDFVSSKGSIKIDVLDKEQTKIYFRGDSIVRNLRFPEDFKIDTESRTGVSKSSQHSKKFNPANFAKLDIQTKIDLDQMNLYGLKLEKIQGVFSAVDDRIRLKIDNFLLEQGSSKADFIYDFSKSHYKLDLNSANILAENFLSLVGIKDITGRANLLVGLVGSGRDFRSLIASSVGRVEADITDGKISKLNFLPKNLFNLSKLSFDHLRFVSKLEAGRLLDVGSELKSNLVDCSFKGYVDILNEKINYLITPTKIYNSNIISKNMVITIEGALDKPVVKFDTAKIMENTAKEITKKIFPKDEGIEKTLNKMLEQFF